MTFYPLEAIGESLRGAIEEAPRFVVERVVEVTMGPDILEASILNQFGHENHAVTTENHLGSTIVQSEVTPEEKPLAASETLLSEQSQEEARAAIDAIHRDMMRSPELQKLNDDDFALAA
jgi:hypothetical protein